MGVRGLTKYINDRPNFYKPYKLHDTKVVIDGNNLIHFLYRSKEIDSIHGGDYNKYANEVKQFFSCFKVCNIEVIVVLDGAHDVSDYLFQNRRERFLQRLKDVKLASEIGTSKQSFIPINLFEVFKSILSEMSITVIQCDNESDTQIAALANHYNCPVLSDDGDFYILDIKQGFITLSHIDKVIKTVFKDNNKTLKYLSCRIYHIDEFLCAYDDFDRNSLPLLATIIGNDFLSYEDLKHFNRINKFFSGDRIDKIIKWFRKHGINQVVKEVLVHIKPHDKTKMKSLIEVSVESYKLKPSDLYFILDKEENYIDKLILNSKLVTPCGGSLPKDFIIAFSKGRSRGDFMNIINFHRLVLSPQVEDFECQSSYDCCRYIRQILYGILLQHDSGNEEVHNNTCVRSVEEYGHCNGTEKILNVAPLFVLPNDMRLLKLSEIYNTSKDSKQSLLAEVMGVEKPFLLSFTPDLQLLFGSIIYWLKNCSPKPPKEFLKAMLLSITYFHILQKSFVEYTIKNDANEEIRESFAVSESERKTVDKEIHPHMVTSYESGTFNVTLVHSYSQLQTCLLYLISLNELLDFPFEYPKLHNMFDGTLLYNLTKHLLESPRSDNVLEKLFGRETEFIKLFDMLLKKTLVNIPEDFAWNQGYRSRKTKRTHGGPSSKSKRMKR